MKILKSTTVPREKPEKEGNDSDKIATENTQEEAAVDENKEKQVEADEELKPDFLIPLSFQSDMGHIHMKAGFTLGGE